jgi:hypothetical protein
MVTQRVPPVLRVAGKGRQAAFIEDLRDRRDELTAHTQEALAFVDRSGPLARQLELALEALMVNDLSARPLWRHLHNIAAGLASELARYERRHLGSDPEPPAMAA